MKLNKYIEHTLLKQDATKNQFSTAIKFETKSFP